MKQQRVFIWIVIITLIVISLHVPLSTQAFYARDQWQTMNGASAWYRIDPLLDSNLSVTGSTIAVVTSANTWNGVGIFNFLQKPWDPTGNIVSTQNFRTTSWCGGGDEIVAGTCALTLQNGMLALTPTKINTSGRYSYNTSGIVNYSTGQADIAWVMTHEFGHWVGLDHVTSPNCVMDQSWQPRAICEDDKQGMALLYGPYTGFDNNRATGRLNYSTFNVNIQNPSTAVVGAENGISPFYGDKMLRVQGDATTSSSSYIYWKIFTSDSDIGPTPRRGTIIPNNSTLKWCQYNYDQNRIGIDAYFSDGTALRDYTNVVDQYGTPISPRLRTSPTRSWICYEFNLNPVANKTVLHWYVAYDNSWGGGNTGHFQAYIDSLKLVWPASKQ